jgi:hypothetical protein
MTKNQMGGRGSEQRFIASDKEDGGEEQKKRTKRGAP